MNYKENIEAALVEWAKLSPEKVELKDWRQPCGTIHCFGGWLPYFEHFAALGVRANCGGAPYIAAAYVEDGCANEDEGTVEGMGPVSEYLFGDRTLFRCRPDPENEAEELLGLTDWQVVDLRLRKLLADTQAQSVV